MLQNSCCLCMATADFQLLLALCCLWLKCFGILPCHNDFFHFFLSMLFLLNETFKHMYANVTGNLWTPYCHADLRYPSYSELHPPAGPYYRYNCHHYYCHRLVDYSASCSSMKLIAHTVATAAAVWVI